MDLTVVCQAIKDLNDLASSRCESEVEDLETPMARLSTTKKKKSPRTDEMGRLKEELRRVTERFSRRVRACRSSRPQ